MNYVSNLKSPHDCRKSFLKGFFARSIIMRSIAILVVVLVLLCVPTLGNAEPLSNNTVAVYNSGISTPNLSVTLWGNVLYDSFGDLMTEYVALGVVLIPSSVSSVVGSADYPLYVVDIDDMVDSLRVDSSADIINISNYYVSVRPYNGDINSFDFIPRFTEPPISQYSDGEITLMSGYPVSTVISSLPLDFVSQGSIGVVVSSFLLDGISIGGADMSNSDVASIEGMLDVPSLPAIDSAFLSADSYAFIATVLGNLMPFLLYPVFSMIAFCVMLGIFEVIKHI